MMINLLSNIDSYAAYYIIKMLMNFKKVKILYNNFYKSFLMKKIGKTIREASHAGTWYSNNPK